MLHRLRLRKPEWMEWIDLTDCGACDAVTEVYFVAGWGEYG
jgi:hypothetical protein